MEQPEQKKSSNKVLIGIIIALIVLGGVGFGVVNAMKSASNQAATHADGTKHVEGDSHNTTESTHADGTKHVEGDSHSETESTHEDGTKHTEGDSHDNETKHEDGTAHTEGDSHQDESKPHVDVTPHN